jgi:hypothetical protein
MRHRRRYAAPASTRLSSRVKIEGLVVDHDRGLVGAEKRSDPGEQLRRLTPVTWTPVAVRYAAA